MINSLFMCDGAAPAPPGLRARLRRGHGWLGCVNMLDGAWRKPLCRRPVLYVAVRMAGHSKLQASSSCI